MTNKKPVDPKKESEPKPGFGCLIVITGRSGVGKDSMFRNGTKRLKEMGVEISSIVTCNTRTPRPGEKHGHDYFFHSFEELTVMAEKEELVEPIVQTGNDFKATPKKAFDKLRNGEHLIWRIDLSRAVEVASGKFAERVFSEHFQEINEKTLVILIDAAYEHILGRRTSRDNKSYSEEEYLIRDVEELKILEEHGHHFTNRIANKEGELDEAVEVFVKLVHEHIKKFPEI